MNDEELSKALEESRELSRQLAKLRREVLVAPNEIPGDFFDPKEIARMSEANGNKPQ